MNKVILAFFFMLLVNITCFAQSKINDSLVKQLDTIATADQMYRVRLESVQNTYGGDSKEMKDLFRMMRTNDSVNLIKVKAIIDKYGWLGANVVGSEGNSTLFMVIQHSALEVQEKYLPLMRDAVKKGNAKASSLALLEDRVALRKGKMQIYGSQVGWDIKTNEHYVLPLGDPENVDKRRAQVGLPPLAVYLSNWQMKWDVEQYKKDLPKIEALARKASK